MRQLVLKHPRYLILGGYLLLIACSPQLIGLLTRLDFRAHKTDFFLIELLHYLIMSALGAWVFILLVALLIAGGLVVSRQKSNWEAFAAFKWASILHIGFSVIMLAYAYLYP